MFRLGRSPVSVVDVTPILVEAPNDIPPVVGFDSDDDAANDELTGVVLVAGLDSGRDDEVVSLLLVAADDVLATVLGAGIEEVVEDAVADEDDAGVVDVVVVEELAGAAAVDTGGDWFVFGGDTT